MNKLLCAYYPTMVTFIDDDEIFLQSISASRRIRKLPVQCFVDPYQAIQHLNIDTYLSTFLERIIRYVEEQEYGEESLGFYFNEIIKEVFEAQRYQQTSVVVVDYEMPAMKGLEVCRKIKNPYIKKILLTGAADESIAIQAFNQGLIHQYIRKHDPHYDQKLYQIIAQAQQDYFSSIFKFMVKAFEYRPNLTALLDPVFIKYFQSLVQQYHICEYYLVEPIGSYFMIDKSGHYKSLITLVEDMLDTFLPDEPTASLNSEDWYKLQQREKIFCFYDPFNPFDPHFQDWKPYIKTPHIVTGRQHYYTYFGDSLISLPDHKIKLYQSR